MVNKCNSFTFVFYMNSMKNKLLQEIKRKMHFIEEVFIEKSQHTNCIYMI